MFQCFDCFEDFGLSLELLGPGRSYSLEELLGMRSNLAESPPSNVRVDLLPILTEPLDKFFKKGALCLSPPS